MQTEIKKITKTEFKDWAEIVRESAMLQAEDSDGTVKEENKEDIFALAVNVSLGDTFSLLFITKSLRDDWSNGSADFRNKKWPEFGNRTHEEWCDYIFQRVNSHHQTRINYTPEKSVIKTRLKNIGNWRKDKDYREKLLSQLYSDNEETYDFIWLINEFFEKMEKNNPEMMESFFNEEIPEEFLSKFIYFWEDYSKSIFDAKEKLAKKQPSPKPNTPGQPKPNDGSTPFNQQQIIDEKNRQISMLEDEKQQLERQKQELEEKLVGGQLSGIEKTNTELLLATNRSLLQENEEKRRKLSVEIEKEKKLGSSKNDSKLAIGLAITAVVIGLLCFIVLLTRKKRREY